MNKFKNLIKLKKKQENGAIATLTLFTILMFITILMGGYFAITARAKSQLQSDIKIQEIYSKDIKKVDAIYMEQEAVVNSNWNKTQHVNGPKILTGMTPIKFEFPTQNTMGTIVTTNSQDTSWYQYGTEYVTRRWANARTQDGSMWVWIPRYAYRIDKENQKIDVVFLMGTTDYYYDSNGELKQAQRQRETNQQIDTSIEYTVHPAFTNETSIGYANGGWDKELSGIWVAKFEAGYASGNNSAEVKASSVTYEDKYSNRVYVLSVENPEGTTAWVTGRRNWLDGIYGTTTTAIKYPTFQPLTYSMNYISISDSFKISKALTESGNIYGLDNTNADSHLMKNSEWGVVAYLAQSEYGKNSEITVNNASLNSGGEARAETEIAGKIRSKKCICSNRTYNK